MSAYLVSTRTWPKVPIGEIELLDAERAGVCISGLNRNGIQGFGAHGKGAQEKRNWAIIHTSTPPHRRCMCLAEPWLQVVVGCQDANTRGRGIALGQLESQTNGWSKTTGGANDAGRCARRCRDSRWLWMARGRERSRRRASVRRTRTRSRFSGMLGRNR